MSITLFSNLCEVTVALCKISVCTDKKQQLLKWAEATVRKQWLNEIGPEFGEHISSGKTIYKAVSGPSDSLCASFRVVVLACCSPGFHTQGLTQRKKK